VTSKYQNDKTKPGEKEREKEGDVAGWDGEKRE